MTRLVGVLQIENNTSCALGLNPTPTFPVGVKLVPGLNTVPKAYLEELEALEVEIEFNGKKNGKVRYPGRERIEEMLKPVRIHDPETYKARTGPQITIYEKVQVGRPEGPPAPEDLRAMTIPSAQVLIKTHNNRDDLERWLKADSRKDVRDLIMAKLATPE